MKKQATSSKPQDTKEKPLAGESKWERQLDKKLVPVGWFLLLFTGLAQMLPIQMETILKISVVGISVQMIVGILAVLVALNFLFRE